MYELSLTRFKRCTKCGCWKPQNRAFFTWKNDKTMLAGGLFNSRCKVCAKLWARDYRRTSKGKEARYLASQKYYWSNAEKMKASARERSKYEDLGKRRIRTKRYYQENREHVSSRQRKLYAESEQLRSYHSEKSREWHYANQDKRAEDSKERYANIRLNDPLKYYAMVKQKNQRRRARRKNAEGSHSYNEILDMIRDQDSKCAYCEIELNGLYHVEHMLPFSRGGSNDWSNLAIACASCNVSKGTKTAEEFMQ